MKNAAPKDGRYENRDLPGKETGQLRSGPLSSIRRASENVKPYFSALKVTVMLELTVSFAA